MAVLHLLGTGAAASDARRTTTMLAVENAGGVVLIDCGGDVIQRALASGIDPDAIEALIVTHEHPDHAGGFALFMERIWLLGRKRPIPVLGIEPALRQARRVLEAFDTTGWDLPAIEWRPVEHRAGAEVLKNERWTITAAPGVHPVPTIGVRVEAAGGGTLAYSCDTEPTPAIVELSRGVDLLVHEASGTFKGHTSNEGAAAVAREAGARRLVLVHLPPDVHDGQLAEARGIFPHTEFGEDGGRYEF
jgi:ribonuclease Z